MQTTRSQAMKADAAAIVTIKAQVPEDAMSASLLGTERMGQGVRIRDDGLIATIGYVIHEAEDVWVSSRGGVTVPGFVVGYDFDSGFGLVNTTLPLDVPSMPLGTSASLHVGDRVYVSVNDTLEPMAEATVLAKQEFAGRWEYLLDEAVFTAPHRDCWPGAPLTDFGGNLCGLSSLVITNFQAKGLTSTVNMFVPIELLRPIIEEVCEHGRRLSPPRPWLGMLVQDERDELTVVGVYRNCPADKAGVKPGDVILRIDDAPVEDLAQMFRTIWSLGSAGVEVPMSIRRESQNLETIVRSGDRVSFQRKGTIQ
jgi:S1-C subfamily serine protease